MKNFISKLTNINIYLFIFLASTVVVVVSVPLVYLFASLLSEPYTRFVFYASVLVPGSMAPPVFYLFITMSNRLNHYQEQLNAEVEENKRKELMLYEQARFAFMGEMLSNISHQWRQPLNTINLAILSAKAEGIHKKLSDKRMMEIFDLIEVNTHYLSSTVDDFKSFFQKKNTHEYQTLNAILDEVQSVILPILKYHSITLIVKQEVKQEIYLNTPLSQVILNLIGNSVDALKAVSHANKEVTLTCKISHGMLEMSCCDNGSGISDEIRAHIFDPYFTTKPKSQGTGIGLYMSRQIVEKMFEGRLELLPASNAAETCFKMRLHYHDEKRKQNDSEH